MVTVGFREVYRYGARFFGYLLVVGGIAGAFLVGGAYLASQAMTLANPSVADLSQTRAFVGVVGMGIGAVLGTIGFYGLAYKLLTESIGRALAAREADLAVSDDGDQAESGGEEVEPAAVRAEESASASEPPGTDGPGSEEPAATDEPTTEGPASRDPVDEQPTILEPGGRGTAEATGDAEEPEPADDDPVETESQPATDPTEDSPPEWTPPDPSEFETLSASDSGSATGPTGEPVPEESADGTDNEHVDPEDVPDDETLADQGVESFQTGGEDDPLADRLPGDEE